MASDHGLYYLSMPHKKNAWLIAVVNTCVVYVTQINCIVSSSNWIMIGYGAILTICIGMAFVICETETVSINTVFCFGKDQRLL